MYYKRDVNKLIINHRGIPTNPDPNQAIFWDGQPGGFEGLHQKGWTVISLLMILREGRKHTTQLKILAKGDNQVVVANFRVSVASGSNDFNQELFSIYRCVGQILLNVTHGAANLGLELKAEETWLSFALLIYGKCIFFRHKVLPCESKKIPRTSSVSNSQILNTASSLSSLSTNILAICSQNATCSRSIIMYRIY